MRAMRMVRRWEYTSRFGYLGASHTTQGDIARTLDYFYDSYSDRAEALHKAERFLSIGDYIAFHASFFSSNAMLDTETDGSVSVEPALLRAVHYVFTALSHPRKTDPKKLLALANAFEALEEQRS